MLLGFVSSNPRCTPLPAPAGSARFRIPGALVEVQMARLRNVTDAGDRHRRLLASVLITLAACSGDGGTGPGGLTVTVSSPITTIIIGAPAQFTATVRDGSGTVVTPGPVTWATSSPSIASVSETGLVIGLGVGQATITATVAGASGSLVLTVSPNPSGTAIVSMPGFSFTPFTTTINAGGTVIYEFPAEPHNVIFDKLAGVPPDIGITANRRVPRTFAAAGTFPFDCTLHPGMSGVVVVR